MAAIEEPKKPMSAYFLYNLENKANVQKELGVKDFGPVTKCLADRWKKLPAAEKATYEKKAQDAKAQYEKDLQAFKESGGVVGARRKEKRDAKNARDAKKAKKEKMAGAPKKPAGGSYGVYLAENKAELQKLVPAGSSVVAVTKLASSKFKALSEKEKAVYEKKYQEKKAKYEEEMKAWKANNATEGDDEDEEDDEEDEEEEEAPKKVRKAGA